MKSANRRLATTVFGAILLLAGFAAGAWHTRSVAAQNKFGQPKTVIHVVIYKWKDGVSDAEKQKALDGVKDMAGKIPGIKNVWLKTQRNQLRDFSGVFVIEFASPEAAADYAESPVHAAWSKHWLEIRESSLSLQVTNP
jgi:hypothetical protein